MFKNKVSKYYHSLLQLAFCCERMLIQKSPVWNYFKRTDDSQNEDAMPTCNLRKNKREIKCRKHLSPQSHLILYITLNTIRKWISWTSDLMAKSFPSTIAIKFCSKLSIIKVMENRKEHLFNQVKNEYKTLQFGTDQTTLMSIKSRPYMVMDSKTHKIAVPNTLPISKLFWLLPWHYILMKTKHFDKRTWK